MRDLLPQLELWLKSGERLALATVIDTWGSAPRKPGSMMAVTSSGDMIGSVSGGCVEGAVVQAAQKSIKTAQPELMHFGVADETAWDVGLACGGSLDVFVQPITTPTFFLDVIERVNTNQDITLATLIQSSAGPVGAVSLIAGATQIASTDLGFSPPNTIAEFRHPGIVEQAGQRIFVNPLPPPPTLVLIGGVHIAIALSRLAKVVDFQTIIIDPRKLFSSEQRFPEVDQILQLWPDKALASLSVTRSTAIASLSHDPKIDDPGLIAALDSDAFYVGALGSPKTHAQRLERLQAAGVSKEKLERLHAPIGLPIGAQTPEEIALAVMAQVIEAYRE